MAARPTRVSGSTLSAANSTGIIALALHLGLRRAEIFALDIRCVHHDNHSVVVADPSGSFDGKCREVPLTDAARHAVHEWIVCRYFLNAPHVAAWLNLHSERTRADPMTRHTFEKLDTIFTDLVQPGEIAA
jgi:site-specific recombinase XerC